MIAVPTRLYAVVVLGRDGRPRGFEKVSGGRFYSTQEDAEQAHAAMPKDIRSAFCVWSFLATFEEVTT